MRRIPEVTAVQAYAGTAKPFDLNGMVRGYYQRDNAWQGEIHIQLLYKQYRERTSHEVAVEARGLLTPIARRAGARITVAEIPSAPPVLQTVVAEDYGSDDDIRRSVAADITALFETLEQEGVMADVDNYLQQPNEIWRFDVDAAKALGRGISVDSINRNVAMAMGNYELGRSKESTPRGGGIGVTP